MAATKTRKRMIATGQATYPPTEEQVRRVAYLAVALVESWHDCALAGFSQAGNVDVRRDELKWDLIRVVDGMPRDWVTEVCRVAHLSKLSLGKDPVESGR